MTDETLHETASWLRGGYRIAHEELALTSDQGTAAWDALLTEVAAGRYGEEIDMALNMHQRTTATQFAAGQLAVKFLRAAEASYRAQPDAYYDMALIDAAAAGVGIITN